jgi:hypothetical protein
VHHSDLKEEEEKNKIKEDDDDDELFNKNVIKFKRKKRSAYG